MNVVRFERGVLSARSRRALRTAILAGCFLASVRQLAGFYLVPPFEHAWIDARIYYEATFAWLHGASPWAVTVTGIPFAAPPPALLLALPFQPLGEDLGVATWVVINVVSVGYLLRRFKLPLYWVLFQPIAEGFLAGSPDLWLAALLFAGQGWLAALTKPYAIPALLAHRAYRNLLAAAIAFAFVVPFLPWQEFLSARSAIESAFGSYTVVVSAFGEPILFAAAVVALVSLPRAVGLSLVTPGLLAQQPHYLLFSLDTLAASLILSVAATIPLPGAMAIGVIAFAIARRLSPLLMERRVAGVIADSAGAASSPEQSTFSQ